MKAGTYADTAAGFAKSMKDAYGEALTDIGRVNIAIFGRTGVGKSTLLNAMFGEERALTGVGSPVTQDMLYYEHPNGLLRIYDSPGFETGEAGDALIEWMGDLIAQTRNLPVSKQIHVVWYCVAASDRRFEDAQSGFVRALSNLGLPVMLVMTQVEHDRDDKIQSKSIELGDYIESLSLPLRPRNKVIYTNALEDEGSRNPTPVHGLFDLLDRTFDVIPKGANQALTAAQHLDIKRKESASHQISLQMAAAAGAAAVVPIPLADSAMIMPIQIAMMARISAIWDMRVKGGTLAALASSAFFAQGIAFVGRAAVRSLLGFIPGVNMAAGVIRAGVASTLTYAVGEAWIAVCLYLNDKDEAAILNIVDSPELRRIFLDAFKAQVKKPLPTRPTS